MTKSVISRLPLFQGLAEEDIDLLATHFRRRDLAKGTVIFRQGEPARSLYVLISGEVAIRFKPPDAEELTVAIIQSGGIFGWSAALGHGNYTSCAVATKDCETIYIGGDQLRALCESNPKTGVLILERLAGVIAERLRNTHAQVVELLRRGLGPEAHPGDSIQ